MAGTKAGGLKAAQTNKEKYGSEFYANIALKAQESWEKNGRKPRGFAVATNYPLDDPRHPANCGKIGGTISKRGKSVK